MTSQPICVFKFLSYLPSDLQIYITEFFKDGIYDYHRIQMREIFANHFDKIFFNNRFNFRNEYELLNH